MRLVSVVSGRAWRALVLSLMLCVLAPAVGAQGWKPSRPVAFMVGAAPGGSIDLTARIIQRVWETQRAVEVPVVVINKPGAGNAIAWTYMNDRGADGHAIAVGTTNLVTNEIIGAHTLGFRDVTPLAILFDDYMTVVVRADSPLKSMADVAERLRRDPAALSVAFAPSLGSGAHTGAAVSLKAIGANVKEARFVAYKSAGEALTAMLGGEIDIVSATAANIPPYLQAGRVRVLAVTAPRRLGGALAGVPTLKEQGYQGVFTNWRGVIGPKGMRKEHIAFWEQALVRLNDSEIWRKDLERNFWTANFLTGNQARQYVEQQGELFRSIFIELGLAK